MRLHRACAPSFIDSAFSVFVLFPLVYPKFPVQARKHILEIHTRDWNPKLAEPFVDELAEKCVGKSDACL